MAENQAFTEAIMTTTNVTGRVTLTASVSPTLPSILQVPTTLQVAPRINSLNTVPTVSVALQFMSKNDIILEQTFVQKKVLRI